MKVKNLVKKYDGKTVVDSVSFEIPKGKVTSLIGSNGAGKSTVMGIISRLIARDSGEVSFEDRDISGWKSRELAKRLAILTQTNNIQMKLTVRELVTFGRFPYSAGRNTAEDEKIIDQALDYMELGPIQDQFIDELSGGQRQRAYIAMGIAQDTEYVLLDEPTNNLDIYHASNMMKIVRRLCDELGKTVILVLHEINYAAFYSDYICAFAGGKIVKMGTVEEVMTKENLAEIAPVLRLTTVSDEGLVEAIRANAQTVGAIFGETEHVDELLAQYDAQIAALAEFAQGKTCVLGMSTSGSFNLLGNDGRCSLIVNEIGFDNIGVDAAAAGSDSGRSAGHGSRDEGNEEESSGRSGSGEGSEGEGSSESGNDASGSAGVTPTHGNEVSFEAIVALNPDYIFVMDRDSAISATGAQLAQEIMENELVMKTDAYRNGNLVILENPGIWYLAEGGITSLGIMLSDLEKALLD
ncbi:MAG: ATP-binding cassette domain-containing protein [Lachnospiraceae bacterium]|nr:ATP-binding cassette domain-containing protein [Lachnospiraceae bacterium]